MYTASCISSVYPILAQEYNLRKASTAWIAKNLREAQASAHGYFLHLPFIPITYLQALKSFFGLHIIEISSFCTFILVSCSKY